MTLDENQAAQPEPVSPTADTLTEPSAGTFPTAPTSPILRISSWPPAQPTFRRRETFPIGLTIALTTLAIVLIVGGLGFAIYSTTTQYGASLHTQVTAQARATVAAQGTALAKTQTPSGALATAQAAIDATATAQSAATATATAATEQVTATATALQDMYRQITSKTPTLDDSLSDNTRGNKWTEGTASAKSACVFTGGTYHVIESQLGFLQPCFAEATDFNNFAYQVQMNITKGSEGGMLFRANNARGQYYLFRIDTQGTYNLEVYNNGQLTTLSSGHTLAITLGLKQTNQVAVIANHTNFYLYINQQYVATVTDTTFSSGQIGVAALDYSTPTEVEFSNVQVWKL